MMKLKTFYNMKKITAFRKAAVIVLAAAMAIPALSSCDKDDDNVTPAVNTITDKVAADANFSLLKQAVVRAGLDGTLKGTGPFTVFAPDDAAFAASGINSAAIDALSPAQLSTLLLYHTVGAKLMAADIPTAANTKVTTASGDSVFVTKNATGVYVNGVKVIAADITADNGVIHKIGKVLKPATGNIVETAVAGGLDSLVKAVTYATTAPGGDATLAGTLSNARLTVFAPSNAAFTALLAALSVTDIRQIPIGTLVAVLKYHVVSGRAFSSDLVNGPLTMIAGGNTTINLTNGTNGGPTVTGISNGANKSNIVTANIVCKNGVVHIIDRVLIP